MSFTYQEKKIDSLYVDKIWHVLTTGDGEYTAELDGNWDIIIFRQNGATHFTVNGIGKKASKVPYSAGVDTVGIALKPGVFLRDYKGEDIVDTQHVLAEGSAAYVQLGGASFKIPYFETAIEFVDSLVAEGILQVNRVTAAFNEGHIVGTSERSLRRHVQQTTGLGPHFLHQIQRAQHAVQLLQQGVPIARAAAEAGYTDQAHMTKAVKQLIGYTPAQIIAKRR